MSEQASIVSMSVSQLELERSGLPASTYISGLARRKAVEAKKAMAMLEFYFNPEGKVWHAKVYLKAAPNAG